MQLGFLRDHGIYYVLREFCALLRDPEARVWFDGLLREAVAAIRELSDFLANR